MVAPLSLAGQKFGRLTVSSRNRKNSAAGKSRWNCICECGQKCVVIGSSLLNGGHVSCGCYSLSRLKSGTNKIHGLTRSPEYVVWAGINDRCRRVNNRAFKNYGGRGISVCKRWKTYFPNFLADMGKKPSSRHTIERIDNSKGYCPKNCCWATRSEQALNTRASLIWTVNGKEFESSKKAAEYFSVCRDAIRQWCNGVQRKNSFTKPRPGCFTRKKYK